MQESMWKSQKDNTTQKSEKDGGRGRITYMREQERERKCKRKRVHVIERTQERGRERRVLCCLYKRKRESMQDQRENMQARKGGRETENIALPLSRIVDDLGEPAASLLHIHNVPMLLHERLQRAHHLSHVRGTSARHLYEERMNE